MAMTEGRTAGELLALLNEALAAEDVCNDVRATSVYEVVDEAATSNWSAEWLRGSGTSVTPDCQRVFIAAKYDLQQRYHLLTD